MYVSGFGLIIALGADFSFCLACVGVLFHGFCFLPEFSKTVLAECCLFPWSAGLVCSLGNACWCWVFGQWKTRGRESEGSIGSLNKRTGKLPMAFCHNAWGNPEKLVQHKTEVGMSTVFWQALCMVKHCQGWGLGCRDS